ncbi:tetratricopeptide repeat-containing sensor histidine kinase [Chitinophaga alhagiae]|uniref:tetratricopeptide repeat-containing sensor histidine kinase n=1 Tax=Chitinophaga alhagiae TaxID=2203219 RepID=UPI0018E4F54A|nr:tetratricopeptide repeat-containing sensor histidine kinase [Chitinophaga alhagiae]
MLLIVIFASACVPSVQEQYEHPAYFNKVFSIADSIGNFDAAASYAYLEQAYAAFPAPGKIDLYNKYARMHSYHATKTYDFPLAMAYADSALYIFNERPLREAYPLYYARALFYKGDVLRELKKYDDAYVYFYRGREALLRTKDTCQYHEYASRLALVYYRQEKYGEAAPYFLEAFRHLRRCDTTAFNTFYTRQGMLDNAALSYDKAGNDGKALVFYDSTLRFIARKGAKFLHDPVYNNGIQAAIAVVYGNKGNVLLRTGDTLGAETLYRQSIDINSRGKDEKRDAQLTMAKLIALYLAGNHPAQAKAVLEEMKASLNVLPTAGTRQQWLLLQWQYYEKTGEQARGYAALKDYVHLNDSLQATAAKPAVADINKEFVRMAGEHRLEMLQKNSELQMAYLFILIFLCLTIMSVAWMIWQNWRKSRRHVAALQQLNQQITAQHENIRKSLSALEQSQLGHYRMMKIVAHDLRNPVGAIHTLSELLLMDPAQEPRNRQMVDLIKTSSASALNLISDLLVLDTSLANMEKELVEVHVALQYCVDLLQIKAIEKQQEIRLEAEPVKVLACREKIWRVFSNLINNAIKFSPDGASIEVALKRENGAALIAVRDYGIGIPEGLQSKLFSQTREAKRKGTRGEESFGFGLSISKQIIEAHNGKIWFETEEGKGTTFYIELKEVG